MPKRRSTGSLRKTTKRRRLNDPVEDADDPLDSVSPESFLSECFEEAQTESYSASSAQFCATGSASTPRIRIVARNENVSYDDEKSLREICSDAEDAPVGVDTQTIIDPTRRVAKQLTNDKFFILSDEWTKTSSETNRLLESIRQKLAPQSPHLFWQLHKINIYEEGGFFKPHADTFRSAGHIGSLVVFLPTKYEGGAFTITHHDETKTIDVGQSQDDTNTCEWIAFYADCPYEVASVESGIRMTLTFHLFVPPNVERPIPSERPQMSMLGQAINRVLHRYDGMPKCIVFPLSHRYVYSDLTPATLKGADINIYNQLAPFFGLKFSCVAITRSDCGYDDRGICADVAEKGGTFVELCKPDYEVECPDSEYGNIDCQLYDKKSRDLIVDCYKYTKYAIELDTNIIGTGNEGCGINHAFRGIGLVVFKLEDAADFVEDTNPPQKRRSLWRW